MTLAPSLRSVISEVGRITQLGFVPQDYDAALRYWTEVMGVGPFFELLHFDLSTVRYRGQPATIDLSAALGYWGDMQIEIIRQHDEAPSIYREWLGAGRTGVNHIGIQVNDFGAASALIERNGGRPVQELAIAGVSNATYFEFPGDGPLVELYAFHGGTFDRLWAYMRREAEGWTGEEPVRAVPDPAAW